MKFHPKLRVHYDLSNKPIESKLVFLGFFFLLLRCIALQAYYEPDGGFNPDGMHTSKLISLLTPIAIICCFRSKILNAVPIIDFPMVIIAFFVDDFSILIAPQKYSLLWFLDALTNHLPIIFVAIYLMLIGKHSLSKEGIYIAFGILFLWFLIVDDHINGTLNGTWYIIAVFAATMPWLFVVVKRLDMIHAGGDPLIAPIIQNMKIVKQTIP
jgi:hypothetical protein